MTRGKSEAAKASEKRRVQRQKEEARNGIVRLAVPGSAGGGGKGHGGGHKSHGGGHHHHGRGDKAVNHALETGDLDSALRASDGPWADLTSPVTQRVVVACLRHGRVAEALALVTGCAARGRGLLPLKVFAEALQDMSQLSGVAEAVAFVEGAGAFVSFPRPECRSYFLHFARLIVLEFLEEAGACLTSIRMRHPRALAEAGQAILDVRAAQLVKGGQLAITSATGGQVSMGRGRDLGKGDSLLLSLMTPFVPPAGGVGGAGEEEGGIGAGGAAAPTQPPPPAGLEVEVVSVFPVFAVKVHGGKATSIPADVSGLSLRVDRLASRITMARQHDALLAIAGAVSANAKVTVDDDVRSFICPPVLQGVGAVPASGGAAGTASWALVGGGTVQPPQWSGAIGAGAGAMDPSARADAVVAHIAGGMNPSQRAAVRAGLLQRFTLVLGPPGTGKTHTAVALIRAWLAHGTSPILATGDSNTAVDNLLEALAHSGVRAVRVGRPESIRPELISLSLDALSTPGLPRDELVRLQKAALRRAQVVCATCSGSGSAILEGHSFAAAVLDESSQATEPAALVPLTCGAPRQVALFGDNRQLPPTVVSRTAELSGLAVSLFDRLVQRGVAPLLLDVQYRMHAALAAYPSAAFYGGAVRTGVLSRARAPPRGFAWPLRGVGLAFVHAAGTEVPEGTSHVNAAEVALVVSIVRGLLEGGELPLSAIGVITPYAAQVRALRGAMRVLGPVDVGSVDGFQGREKEVVVFSAVRANARGALGFLADARRINVMLTRARRGLVVCGHLPTLQHPESELWGPLLVWARARGLVCGAPPSDPAAAAALAAIDADQGVLAAAAAQQAPSARWGPPQQPQPSYQQQQQPYQLQQPYQQQQPSYQPSQPLPPLQQSVEGSARAEGPTVAPEARSKDRDHGSDRRERSRSRDRGEHSRGRERSRSRDRGEHSRRRERSRSQDRGERSHRSMRERSRSRERDSHHYRRERSRSRGREDSGRAYDRRVMI